MTQRSKRLARRSTLLTVATAVAIAGTSPARPARAEVTIGAVIGVAMTAANVAQQLYSGVQWTNCKFGMSCPQSEAATLAQKLYNDVTAVSQQLDNNNLMADFKSLMMAADLHFRVPIANAAYDTEEAGLKDAANTLFFRYVEKLKNTNTADRTAVVAAYNLTPFFVMMSGLVDGTARTILAHGRVPMDIRYINDIRQITLETLNSLVGAQSLWYACSSIEPVSNVATVDDSFPTRKLFRMFTDWQFSLSSCDNNCNLSRHYDVPRKNICQRDCGLLPCQACGAAADADVLRSTLPKAVAKMSLDSVVQGARAHMEFLVKLGALHNTAFVWRQNDFPGTGQMSLWNIWSGNSYRSVNLNAPPPSVWQPVVTGDFNGDGYDDILWDDKADGIMSTWNFGENQAITYPAGVWGTMPGFMYTPLTHKSKVFSGDVDGDGISDVIFATSTQDQWLGQQSWFVTWFMQAGSATPRMTSTSGVTNQAVQAVGNFDNDPARKADLFFRSSGGLTYMSLNGGAMVPVVRTDGSHISVDNSWTVKDVGDFNADGKADIIWQNTNGWVSIWNMNGPMLVGNPVITTVPASSGWRVQGAADVDHDGISDIVWQQTYGNATGGPISVWFMDANATTFRQNTVETVPAGMQLIGFLKQGPAAPMNSPLAPIPELRCGSTGKLRNPGFANYEQWQSGATFDGGRGTMAGDVNGDGRAELITVSDTSVLSTSLSGGSFTPPTVAFTGAFAGTRGTFLADIDGDGFSDLVAVDDFKIRMAPSLGPWSWGVQFGAVKTLLNESFYGTQKTLVGDVDGDGKADIVNVNANKILMRRSLGSSLAGAIEMTTVPSVGTLVDVTGDGKADLVSVGTNSISVRRSTGTSFLAAESWHPPGWFLGTHGAALGDVDGDGRADVVWSTDYSVSVLRSTGSSFKPGEVWFSGGAFYANHGIFVADFDGNGRGDHVAIGDGYIGALRSQ